MKTLFRNAAALAAVASLAMPLGASAKSSAHRTFDGTIVHISGTNIKVKGTEGGKEQTLSFLYVPRVGKVSTKSGDVTTAQKALHVGEYVRVTYDQKALGIRHVDMIAPHAMGPGMKE